MLPPGARVTPGGTGGAGRAAQRVRQADVPLADAAGVLERIGAAELLARDKASLDIFWLKDDSLADSDNLPPPGVIAQEIVEDLQAALDQFKRIAVDMGAEVAIE